MRRRAILVAAALGLIPAAAWAAPVSYSTVGGAYTQDFNTLASTGTSNAWSDGSTVAGWYALVGGLIGSATTDANLVVPTTYVASDGSASQVGKLLSLGADSDRALGTQSGAHFESNSVQVIALLLKNDTGQTLNSFDLSYQGEKWRSFSYDDGIDFDFQVFASEPVDLKAAGGWTDVDDLDFNSIHEDPSSALLSASGISLNWQPDEILVLRWSDRDNTTHTFMLGVDDVEFSAAVPEPSIGLIGMAGTLLFGRRRRS